MRKRRYIIDIGVALGEAENVTDTGQNKPHKRVAENYSIRTDKSYPRMYTREELEKFRKENKFDDIPVRNGDGLKSVSYITAYTDRNEKDVVIECGDPKRGAYTGDISDMLICENERVDMYFEEGFKRIADNAYSETPIEHCVLAESIEEIGEYAFADCKQLESVIIPNGLKYIRKGAFEGCTALKSIELPSTVEIVEDGAFEGCEDIAIHYGKE
jgi:hypothetical protein